MVKILTKPLKKAFSFPGSVLLIPMFLSAIVNSFFASTILIGDPINSLFDGSGVMTLMFMMLFVSGMQLRIKDLNSLLKEVMVLIVLRILIVVIVYMLFIYLFANQSFFGVYGFTLMIALCSTNPGLFVALVDKYGQSKSLSLFGPLSILSLPAIPLAIYSLKSSVGFDILPLIAILIPFLLGMLVGNLLPTIKEKFKGINPIILFFWGFGIGSKINLLTIFDDVRTGLILVLLYYLLIVIPLYLLERLLLKSNGVLAISSSSIAAVALIIPEMLEINNMSSDLINASINQLAFAVLLTSFITPFILSKFQKKLI